MVRRAHIEEVVAQETRNDEDVMQEALGLTNAFDTPRYRFDGTRKAYT